MRHFPSGWSGAGSLCWARPREKSSSSASSAVSGGRTAACGGFPRRSSKASRSPASRKRPGTCTWGQVSTCHMEGQVSTCHIVSSRPKPALPASARRRAGSSSSTGVSSSRSAGRSGGHSCAASDARLSIDLTNLASPDARESSRLPSAMTDFRSLGAALGQRLLRVSVRSPERCLCQRIWSASRASHLSLSIALQHHRSCFCRWEIHSRSSHARMLDRLPQSFP